MLIFPWYFDGRPCSFRRSHEVLGSLGGAFWGVLGHMFGPQEPSGRSWGSVFGARGLSGRSWGKRARDLRAQGGPWKPNLAMQRGVLDAKTHIFTWFFDDFQKRRVFQRRAPGVVKIRLKTLVFAPGGALGASLEGNFLALGSLEASKHHDHVFFGRQGVPLERPRHASLQMMMVKPMVF